MNLNNEKIKLVGNAVLVVVDVAKLNKAEEIKLYESLFCTELAYQNIFKGLSFVEIDKIFTDMKEDVYKYILYRKK